MQKIKDGTYRAVRMDASGYVYGCLATPNWPYVPKGRYFISERGQDSWVTPIKKDTLVYRKNGRWYKHEL